MTLLLIYLFIALAVSFLCSLLEAALLSVPRSHVAVLRESGSKIGVRLQEMKDDIDRPLAAILTLNTFAHTLGAAGVGAQATMLWGEVWVGVVSVVVTLIILVFSEIIPKTLGAVHAKRLAAFTAHAVHMLIVVLLPVVAICDWLSKVFAGRNQAVAFISRSEMRSLAHLAVEEGAIDQQESHIIRNLLALREVTVEQVMTPRTVVFALSAEMTVAEASQADPTRFARIPVIGSSLDDVRGVISRHDLFIATNQGNMNAKLKELARPLHAVPELAKLTDVLHEFLNRREHLFLAVDEYGGTAGIVTLEDVLETLLGVEIVDETDTVEDMQQLARQLLKRRRER